MKKNLPLTFFLIVSLFMTAVAQTTTSPSSQTPPQEPATPQKDDGEVVRITTNLVQVDAVVIDKNGKQVTDVRKEDFEILEDNRPQKITNFSYVTAQPAAASTGAPATAKSSPAVAKNMPPAPTAPLRREQVRRTFALVVDDLGLSFESTFLVRRGLKKFVDEQMQPGDLVAILRTRAGMGALQQFTSDKRQLYAAIDRVHWYPAGTGGVSAFAPLRADDRLATGDARGYDSLPSPGGAKRVDETGMLAYRQQIFSIGTLGAVNYIVRGLQALPGRKSVVLFSDGLQLFDSKGKSGPLYNSLLQLIDLANRASVVVYTMDARGLQTLGLTAEDNSVGLSADQLQQTLAARASDFDLTRDGLRYLASQTGGLFIRDTNDLGRGLRRVLEDQSGYYLIGYRPDEGTFDPVTGRRRISITARIKGRPDLTVRMRNGFFNVTDEQRRTTRPSTPQEQMLAALTSPFNSGEMNLRLTSLFSNDARAGSFLRSLLYVNMRDVSFKKEPDGLYSASIDIAAYAFGDSGKPLDTVQATQPMRVREDVYQRLRRDGLVYILNIPVKKPGAYQLRVAVRDSANAHVGSASQFAEVPDINKNHLTLSGILLSGETMAAATNGNAPINASLNTPAAKDAHAADNASGATADSAADSLNGTTGAAIRQLKRGMTLNYGLTIYDAQLDRTTHRPQLQKQIRLFRDGQLVYTSAVQAIAATGEQPDWQRLPFGGHLRLSSNVAPGNYILQVIVTDNLAKEKNNTATQYMDFEIVE